MADAPDLVLRAAARLAKGVQPSTDAETQARRVESVEPVLAKKPPLPADFAAGRMVNLSPSALAANGIALPSAGYSRRVEEFRSIKRQVLSNAARASASGIGDRGRTVMVTSATPGNGKTFISINLALSVAFERDLNVILIDADAHRQSMLSYLSISADKGWLDVLSGEVPQIADVVLRTNVPGLSIIPAGKPRPEIPELLASRKMAEFMAEVAGKDANRLVILDTLPCLVSTEPTVLSSLVGQALFVVAANQTSKEEIEASLRLMEACPNISLILNKGDPLLIDQFGKYGYGYGYQANT